MVSKPPLTCTDVGLQIDGRWLLRNISFTLNAGSVTALVGPNGAGKSTMLSLLAGDREPSAGEVIIDGRSPTAWRSAALAQRRSVMRQHQQLEFAFSVAEVVRLGRMPYRVDTARDLEIVAEAMAAADVAELSDRDVTTLSGGEGARSAFARTLAQTAPIVMLDEPTAALDLRHQEALLSAAAQLRTLGCCVTIVLHDLNLAARYADRVLVFEAGRLVADGAPGTVLTAELVGDVYHQPVTVLRQPGSDLPLIVALPPEPTPIGPAIRAAVGGAATAAAPPT